MKRDATDRKPPHSGSGNSTRVVHCVKLAVDLHSDRSQQMLRGRAVLSQALPSRPKMYQIRIATIAQIMGYKRAYGPLFPGMEPFKNSLGVHPLIIRAINRLNGVPRH